MEAGAKKRKNTTQSKKLPEFSLNWLQDRPGSKCDYYFPGSKTIYECYGDFYHGFQLKIKGKYKYKYNELFLDSKTHMGCYIPIVLKRD